MANPFDPPCRRAPARASAGRSPRRRCSTPGCGSYMLSVYNYMTSGVLLTGVVALLFARSGLVYSLFDPATGRASALGWVGDAPPRSASFSAMSFGVNRMSEFSLKALFWGYAAIMGVSLSTIFLRYTGGSIAATFFATAASFASLSLYGYTTKRDLSGFGKFLLMGVVGLVVAMLINAFFPSAAGSLLILVRRCPAVRGADGL